MSSNKHLITNSYLVQIHLMNVAWPSHEFNYLTNINHPDFQDNSTLVRTENYFWDERVL